MMTIKIFDLAGEFAENKDLARTVRINQLIPALEKGQDVVLDFEGVDATTQSFIHALLSDVIRRFGSEVLEKMRFKQCSLPVQKIIGIVTDYAQEGI